MKRAISIFLGVTVKKTERPRRAGKLIRPILILLLAVLCIGGVELFVCSFQDPALYDRITAPVRAEARRLADAGRRAWTDLERAAWELDRAAADTADRAAARLLEFWEGPAPEPDEEADLQLVDRQEVAPPPSPQADSDVTALESREGLDYLIGAAHQVVYYDQTSERWADASYGTDPLSGYGCGPTAMSIVVSTLAEEIVDPAQMAQLCADSGYWSKRNGSYWSIVPGISERFGLTCAPLPPEEADLDTVSSHLIQGDLLVAMMGRGHFTNSGHFIVLRGVTLDGSILVADPASVERSLTPWDLDLILEELSSRRHNGGPLWVVSVDYTP